MLRPAVGRCHSNPSSNPEQQQQGKDVTPQQTLALWMQDDHLSGHRTPSGPSGKASLLVTGYFFVHFSEGQLRLVACGTLSFEGKNVSFLGKNASFFSH